MTLFAAKLNPIKGSPNGDGEYLESNRGQLACGISLQHKWLLRQAPLQFAIAESGKGNIRVPKRIYVTKTITIIANKT